MNRPNHGESTPASLAEAQRILVERNRAGTIEQLDDHRYCYIEHADQAEVVAA